MLEGDGALELGELVVLRHVHQVTDVQVGEVAERLADLPAVCSRGKRCQKQGYEGVRSCS